MPGLPETDERKEEEKKKKKREVTSKSEGKEGGKKTRAKDQKITYRSAPTTAPTSSDTLSNADAGKNARSPIVPCPPVLCVSPSSASAASNAKSAQPPTSAAQPALYTSAFVNITTAHAAPSTLTGRHAELPSKSAFWAKRATVPVCASARLSSSEAFIPASTPDRSVTSLRHFCFDF